DVLADLPAALGADRDRDAVAPAPDPSDLARIRRRDHLRGAGAEHLGHRTLETPGLGALPVRLGEDHEARVRGDAAERGPRRCERALVEELERRDEETVAEDRLDRGAPTARVG